jgi:hypothetical protein
MKTLRVWFGRLTVCSVTTLAPQKLQEVVG